MPEKFALGGVVYGDFGAVGFVSLHLLCRREEGGKGDDGLELMTS